MIKDIPRAGNYFDDILISGDSEEEHLTTLELVLTRLEEAGLRLKREKCSFLQPTVTYLGHVIDGEGIHPDQAKVEAVKLAPTPTNVLQLPGTGKLLQWRIQDSHQGQARSVRFGNDVTS